MKYVYEVLTQIFPAKVCQDIMCLVPFTIFARINKLRLSADVTLNMLYLYSVKISHVELSSACVCVCTIFYI